MFRFTIRDLILLTAIAAIGIGWWLDRRALMARYSSDMQQLGATLKSTRARLAEAEDLLEYEGVVFGDGQTIHTTPDHAADLRRARAERHLR